MIIRGILHTTGTSCMRANGDMRGNSRRERGCKGTMTTYSTGTYTAADGQPAASAPTLDSDRTGV